MASTTDNDLRLFANISDRDSCPRCLGYGFKHESNEKHDKPLGQRCKRCSDCIACQASGVVFGKVACSVCSSRGFIHPNSAVKPHFKSLDARCPECITCKECIGHGVVSKERVLFKQHARNTAAFFTSKDEKTKSFLPSDTTTYIQASKKENHSSQNINASPSSHPLRPKKSLESLYPESIADSLPPIIPDLPPEYNMFSMPPNENPKKWKNTNLSLIQKFLPTSLDMLHPHLHDSSIRTVLELLDSEDKPTLVQKHTEEKNTSTAAQASSSTQRKTLLQIEKSCVNCEGCGFVHTSAVKHDKQPGVRCKHCNQCKICNGSGIAGSKVACTECGSKGFIHGSKEREHDVPDGLRCFFCVDCKKCKGTGSIDKVRPLTMMMHQEKHKSSSAAKANRANEIHQSETLDMDDEDDLPLARMRQIRETSSQRLTFGTTNSFTIPDE